jgi:recombination protein RecT
MGVAGLRATLNDPNVQNRMREVLRDKAPAFCSSLITISNDYKFQNVEPHSILGSAMIAATLDLPIEKSLGFAHIVPYGSKAQFQIGAKGLVQLALRSGQYKKMNAFCVNRDAFGGYDEVGDPVILWDKLDETEEIVGYAFAWTLVTGFTKIVYWTKEKVEQHAAKYSQAYRYGKQNPSKADSPWFTAFDQMALKTVIKSGITHWGIMSVQLQTAVRMDNAAVADIDAPPEYIDNTNGVHQIKQATVDSAVLNPAGNPEDDQVPMVEVAVSPEVGYAPAAPPPSTPPPPPVAPQPKVVPMPATKPQPAPVTPTPVPVASPPLARPMGRPANRKPEPAPTPAVAAPAPAPEAPSEHEQAAPSQPVSSTPTPPEEPASSPQEELAAVFERCDFDDYKGYFQTTDFAVFNQIKEAKTWTELPTEHCKDVLSRPPIKGKTLVMKIMSVISPA